MKKAALVLDVSHPRHLLIMSPGQARVHVRKCALGSGVLAEGDIADITRVAGVWQGDGVVPVSR